MGGRFELGIASLPTGPNAEVEKNVRELPEKKGRNDMYMRNEKAARVLMATSSIRC